MTPRACPQCGATLSGSGGFAACDYCGATLHLGTPTGVGHDMLRPELAEGDVASRLTRWLRARDTMGDATVTAARLLYLPAWDLPGADPRPAGGPPRDALPLPSAAAVPFDPDAVRTALVVEPAVPLASLVDDAARPPTGTRLVHLPFWSVTYRLFTREHTALVDAVEGRVVPLSFPVAAGERWLDGMHAAVMVVVFLLVYGTLRDMVEAGTPLVPGAWHILVAGPAAFGLFWLAGRLRLR